MSSNRVLENVLRDILGVIGPANNDWVVRFQVIEELKGVVRSLESLRGATVEPYGSFVSNLFTNSGDLDISIELANGLFISSSGKKEKQKLLRALMRAMRRKGGWDCFQFIPHARVPILKAESCIQNISCDISIDNLQAQMKSKFLLWVNEIDTRFRDMVLLVKEWAKAHNLNNPKSGTFNSYSLSLLVVFHFQTCAPAIFPPLKDIYPGNMADDLTGLRANAEKHISETCAANITKFRLNSRRAVNRSSLSELFISFLAKFSDINLRASDLGICPFTGQWEYIRSNTRWLPQNHAIFIEDPFEQPANSARTVNERQLTRISEAFKMSHTRVLAANQNSNSLLATLVQQQTFRSIPRLPRNNSVGFHQPTRPQWQGNERPHSQSTQNSRGQNPQHVQYRPQITQRAVISYAQVQPQYQMVQYQNHSSSSTTTAGPYVQAQHGQTQQQTWRPRSSTSR